MTIDQVKFLTSAYYTKDTRGDNIADGVVVTNDDQHIFDNTKGFMIWDDGNEFIHQVQINNDHYTQVQAPIQIATASYEKILYMEAKFSMKHFEQALEAICGHCLSDDQKKRILIWANSIRNTNLAPIDHRPYYQKDVTIPGKNHSPLVREDLANDSWVKENGGFDN